MIKSPLGNHTASEFISLKWKKFLKPKLFDKDDDVWQALWRSALAELFGTAIFVFFGTGAVAAAQNTLHGGNLDTAALLLISMAFGFGLTVVIYSIGEISGGHVNPAVTWATLMTGRLSIVRAAIYWVCQMVGAICGSAVLAAIIPDGNGPLAVQSYAHGCNSLNSAVSRARGFGCELVFTFIFVFVVFATAISPFVGKIAPLSGGGNDYGPGKLTPLCLGLCILVLHIIAVPLTGAGFNPARSFGPAVIAGNHDCWSQHWIYWVGPFVGATIAATIATLIFLAHPNSIKSLLVISRGEEKYNSTVAPSIPESTTHS
jgi:MIP family channel proteins